MRRLPSSQGSIRPFSGVAYSLHDIEHEDGAAEKAIAISGQQHIPVIRFADGSWLVEPSATQLQAKCKELGLI